MFKLQFKTDNAAFENLESECAAIMRRVAYAIEHGASKGGIRDTNGNTVGEWSVTRDE